MVLGTQGRLQLCFSEKQLFCCHEKHLSVNIPTHYYIKTPSDMIFPLCYIHLPSWAKEILRWRWKYEVDRKRTRLSQS